MSLGTPRPHPLLRALGARWYLGKPFGVPVELHCLALALTVGMGLWEYKRIGCSWGEASTHALVFFVCLYALVWVHEMGHVMAGWRYNIPTSKITLWPLGGLAHLSEPAPGPRQDMVVSLAGPATHVLWMLVLWPLYAFVAPHCTAPEGWFFSPLRVAIEVTFFTNLAMAVFNLLPFFPMDGGRVLIAFLTLRAGEFRAVRWGARVGLAGAALLVLAGLWIGSWSGGLLLALGINNGLTCWRLLKASQWGAHMYAERRREAWEGDPEAWRRGGGHSSQGTDRDRRRREREAAKAEKAAAQREAEAEEIDRLLARVSEVGLPGLSRKERARLETLSKRRRKD